ncbi:MAG: prepilin-type N-terminal cleavage/methylation domain-containing protein, partial [Opitutae bacterium]|nr:prepilin-type N-terminal cleavage/methylation domain-containing protein [Opitutae bacterium]
MKTDHSNGFTLLELLIVLAVMGLMMGLIGFSLLGGGGAELG